jgi:acyl CoA:acetate/3-ketoacid CoA transferase alpha subunit
MSEAVAAFVPDGASVCMGAALEAAIPFAAGHELIRQRRRDLNLVGPISDMLFDQLIAAGCARKITAAWVGNVSAGLGHAYRRAVESAVPRAIEVEDHSDFTLALALQAGALGAPYIPTRSLLGTGLLDSNPTLRRADDPFSGGPLVLVPALAPDVAIVHVQRADEEGHAHACTPGHARGGPGGAASDRGRRGDPAARRHPPRSQPRAGAAVQGRGGARAVRRVPVAGAGPLRARSRVLPRLPRGDAHRRWRRGAGSGAGSPASPTGRASSRWWAPSGWIACA